MGTFYTCSPVVRTRSASVEPKELTLMLPKISNRTAPKPLNRSFSFAKEVSHAKPMYNSARYVRPEIEFRKLLAKNR